MEFDFGEDKTSGIRLEVRQAVVHQGMERCRVFAEGRGPLARKRSILLRARSRRCGGRWLAMCQECARNSTTFGTLQRVFQWVRWWLPRAATKRGSDCQL
jgi:hypothetical protein